MRTIQRCIVAAFAVASLCFDANSAIADEADDAVQILSTLWKGGTEHYTNEFTGDSKTFRLRWESEGWDGGIVLVKTDETSFRFLEIADPATWSDFIDPNCKGSGACVMVTCLFGRSCVSSKIVFYDPVYHDPRRERTESFPNSTTGTMGYVNPMNYDKVLEALRTLIRLNAPPPFVSPR